MTTKKPDGKTAHLNPAWKDIFLQVFAEAKLIIFLVSEPWLNSPNCHAEFQWLCTLIEQNPTAKNMVVFWKLDEKVEDHHNWPVLMKKLSNIALEVLGYDSNFWDDYSFDFSSKAAQDDAVARALPLMTQLCNIQPRVLPVQAGWMEICS